MKKLSYTEAVEEFKQGVEIWVYDEDQDFGNPMMHPIALQHDDVVSDLDGHDYYYCDSDNPIDYLDFLIEREKIMREWFPEEYDTDNEEDGGLYANTFDTVKRLVSDSLTASQMRVSLEEKHGYQTQNLWSVSDVIDNYEDVDKETAIDILNSALTNDATMEQIWFTIHMEAEDRGLKRK